MNRFEFARAGSFAQARELVSEKEGSVLKAGGIDLLDHLKEHLLEPPRLVDLRSIPGRILAGPDGALQLGALVTLAQVAASPEVQKGHRALAQACGEAASPQIRNVATLGGSVLQRPRCWYYRSEAYKCLKKGGDLCYALTGGNRYHVIFGGGPSFAPHPSNSAVALVALGAEFTLEGKAVRKVPAGEFFVLPEADPTRENHLLPGEILTEIHLPPRPLHRSAYDEIRERASFDWPLVSAAVSLKTVGGVVQEPRIVLGQVAPIPWRSTKAEEALVGKKLDAQSADEAARAAVQGAQPLQDNAYKVDLVKTLVRRLVLSLA